MFNSIIGDTLSLQAFFACLGVAFILGLVVALTHKKTTKSNSNFTTTLAILPSLVAMAILLVNGNLGAGVATLGVFSLVRFRSIPGNSRSLLAVFFAMTIGLAAGTGYLAFAAIFTAIIAAAILALYFFNFGGTADTEKRLTVLVPEDLDYTDMFDDIFAKYTTSQNLINTKTTNMGSLFELSYNLVLKNGINEKEFIDEVRSRNGNLKVILSLPREEEIL